jgi:hypothetical protein
MTLSVPARTAIAFEQPDMNFQELAVFFCIRRRCRVRSVWAISVQRRIASSSFLLMGAKSLAGITSGADGLRRLTLRAIQRSRGIPF